MKSLAESVGKKHGIAYLPEALHLGLEKERIDRKILDLCRHLQELDVREEYGPDLEEFKKSI